MLEQRFARLKQWLLEERERLREQYNLIESSMDTALEDAVSELSTYDNHPADLGTEDFERSKDLALREDVRIKMVQVEDALKKMEEGSYGICDVCGREIPYARLEAIPYTTMCRRCREGPYGESGLEGHEFLSDEKWDSGYQGTSYKFGHPERGGKGNDLDNRKEIVAVNKFKSARIDKKGDERVMKKEGWLQRSGDRGYDPAGLEQVSNRVSNKGERAAKNAGLTGLNGRRRSEGKEKNDVINGKEKSIFAAGGDAGGEVVGGHGKNGKEIESIAPLWSGEEATQERDSRRPAEEDILAPPFENAIREGTGDVMYDGEDAWQEVARTTEHAEGSQAGAYYGDGELEDEDRGHVEEVDGMPYVKGEDGIIYRKLRGNNDEDGPEGFNG